MLSYPNYNRIGVDFGIYDGMFMQISNIKTFEMMNEDISINVYGCDSIKSNIFISVCDPINQY